MAVMIWTVGEFTEAVRSHSRREFDDDDEGFNTYLGAIMDLSGRAHKRGDGVAVYVNNDLGHPDIGQWQVASYGGPEAQLETRGGRYDVSNLREGHREPFVHGVDQLTTSLPDIGGRINWRYTLEAVCPSLKQQVKAAELVTHRVVRFYRDERERGGNWFDGHEIEV